jgi:hypothetical protein
MHIPLTPELEEQVNMMKIEAMRKKLAVGEEQANSGFIFNGY